MISGVLVRFGIINVAITLALIVRLGFAASISENLLRMFLYAAYLSVVPTIVWFAIYGLLMMFRGNWPSFKLDFVKTTLTDVVFSSVAVFVAFYWLYWGTRNSVSSGTIFNEGVEKMADGKLTLAGMYDVVESLFSVMVALQIANFISIILSLYRSLEPKINI
jgi:hypothetical protein